MCKRLLPVNHQHIVRALGSFERDSKGVIILEYAEGDLAQFLRTNPQPGPSRFHWIMQQCLDLVDALSIIHGRHDTAAILHDTSGQRLYGRHGDIKPQNILWFPKQGDGGIFKLADFGASSFHSHPSKCNVRASSSCYSPTYRAPEFDLPGARIGRSADVWALGCTFLECLTWYVGGSDGVRRFAQRRTTKTEDGNACSAFSQTRLDVSTGKRLAEVKPSVEDVSSPKTRLLCLL